MKLFNNKRGISLVALIITIIVMVILTSAVVMVGMNVPAGASLAVFKASVGNVQEAVTMKLLNNSLKNVNVANKENLKWVGVVKDYDGSEAINFNEGQVIAGRLALPLSEELSVSRLLPDSTCLPPAWCAMATTLSCVNRISRSLPKSRLPVKNPGRWFRLPMWTWTSCRGTATRRSTGGQRTGTMASTGSIRNWSSRRRPKRNAATGTALSRGAHSC